MSRLRLAKVTWGGPLDSAGRKLVINYLYEYAQTDEVNEGLWAETVPYKGCLTT